MLPLFYHPLLWLMALLFVAHQWLQKVLQVSVPWADAYLDNLLGMPLLLTGWLAERYWRFGQRRLAVAEMLVATLVVIVVSEVVFPRLSDRFTPDGWDVVAYLAGALVFGVMQRE